MVTAEAAVVLPLVALFALVLVWLIALGIDQVRVVDAARDAAREVARGDDQSAAAAAARRTAGDGASVQVRSAGPLVSVTVSELVRAPRWLLVPLPAVTLRSTSSLEAEDAAPTR